MNNDTGFNWGEFIAELGATQQSDNNPFELNWGELLKEAETLSLLFNNEDKE